MARHAPFVEEEQVHIKAGELTLAGDLALPHDPSGIVLFAHGSGSGRHSPRNRFVADQLQRSGLATLLFDLRTEDEETIDRYSGHLRFDIGLLAERPVGATDWVGWQGTNAEVAVGHCGPSPRRRAGVAA